MSFTSGTTVASACVAGSASMTGSYSTMTPYTLTTSSYSYLWGKQIEIVMVDPTSTSETSFTVLDRSSSTSATSPSTTTPADPNRGIPTGSKKGGISGGAIAGIVIGVLAVALLVAGALFFARRRKHRNQAASVANTSALPEYVGGNGVTQGPGQMATQSSTGLFQPQPEYHGPAR
jgi:hypothetical protein